MARIIEMYGVSRLRYPTCYVEFSPASRKGRLLAMVFAGIPAEAFDFYESLAVNNSRGYWAEHKADYDTNVREPMIQLAEALEPVFGAAHLFRPHRDIRFSRDKTPYKDHQGMFIESRNGLGWYLQVSAQGLMAAGGWHSSTPEQVARYRAAVADDDSGKLGLLLDDACATGLTIAGNRLKTRPRDYAADHPRIALLRYRSLYLSRSWEPQAWMGTPQAVERIRSTWEAITPTLEWLAAAAGPVALPNPGGHRRP